jgi:hypothetical protein
MRNTLRALALTFALLPGLAVAQTFPSVPDRTVIGRIGTGSASGPSQAIPWATLAPRLATVGNYVIGPFTCAAHLWISSISSVGLPVCTQPAFSDISGQWALTQGPTLGASTFLGSVAGGTPIALTQVQATALMNLATSSLQGALPPWPNNTTTFFRGDGTYATLNFAALSGQAAFAQFPTGGATDTIIGYWASTVASALAINNCANALTYSTSTHTFGCNAVAGTGTVTTAGTGLSLTGAGSTLNLALTNATLQASPTNPTGTGNVVGLMMGLGTTCKITPVYSTRVNLNFQGVIQNTTSTASTTIQARFGTGTAPANATSITGTAIGSQVLGSNITGSNWNVPYSIGGIITGLTPGTAYWFDFSLAASTGTATAISNSCSAFEF